MRLDQTIPAMPVRDVAAAVAFYRDRLGFEAMHHDGGFAVMSRDDAVVHLWEAGDEGWRRKIDPKNPVCTGAESFIAGTASFRVRLDSAMGVDELYEELRRADVLHSASKEGVEDTDFGTREFSATDLDGNLIGFFTWVER
ncbi:MAG: VOC family protein [Actinomycetota bacterium]|nr:VOC family protein [Actinomycetota bacterium]